MKKTPYNQKRANEIGERIKSFEFKAPQSYTPNVLIHGQQGQGKTHLACSISTSSKKPVYFLDSEGKGSIVTAKFDNIKYAQFRTWEDLFVSSVAVSKLDPGWLIIDSASDMQTYACEDYLEETKRDKIYPIFEWTNVFQRMDSVMNLLKQKGFGLIMTARMKDEYVGDQTTGKKVPRIYNRIPYDVDLVLSLENEKLFVEKNGFTKDLGSSKPQELNRNIDLYTHIGSLYAECKNTVDIKEKRILVMVFLVTKQNHRR